MAIFRTNFKEVHVTHLPWILHKYIGHQGALQANYVLHT